MMQLLLGCGNDRVRRMGFKGDRGWSDLVTVDLDRACKPDVLWDLNLLPLPFAENSADEIHAYHVLEHLGNQGDYESLFAQFSDLWRVLKPDGQLFAMVPHWQSAWTFGDPGHRRIINGGTLTFLSQKEYQKQVGNGHMTDYRHIYKADFECVYSEIRDEEFLFIMKAVK